MIGVGSDSGGRGRCGAVVHFVLDIPVSGTGLLQDECLLRILGADGGHALHVLVGCWCWCCWGVGSGVELAADGSGEASGRIETSEWCERRGRQLGVPNRNEASPRLTGELQLRQGRRTVGRSGGREARRREEGRRGGRRTNAPTPASLRVLVRARARGRVPVSACACARGRCVCVRRGVCECMCAPELAESWTE